MSDIEDYVRARWWPRRSGLLLPRWNNQFSPGGSTCGCCEATVDPCAIFSDDFDRADDSSPGSDWSEENGQVAIGSNKLAYISGSDVACIATTTHTSQAVTITVDVRQTGFVLVTGTEFRVILSYVDTSNYYYAALKIGTSQYLRIVERSGGVDTVLSTTTTTTTINTTYTITACMTGPFIYATCNASGTPEVFAAHTGSSGEFGVGFGTADIFSSFDNFVARAVEDGCEDCERPTCSGACSGEGLPDAVEMTISGVVDGTCGDCEGYNGTFILSPLPESPCIYVYEASDVCGGRDYYFFFGGAGGGGTSFEAAIRTDSAVQDITWEETSVSSEDCRNLVDFDIPWSTHGTRCDGSGSTCTITSL